MLKSLCCLTGCQRDAGMMVINGDGSNASVVEYANRDEAQHAIQTLSNTDFMGRQIFVREV
jgi:hypothetical protein